MPVSLVLPFAILLACALTSRAEAQVEYRNLEGGRPVRLSDAAPTERHALDLDLTTIRVDRLSLGRYRAQIEPRISYGILPRTDISIRALAFYREPSAIPRGTVAGVGVGGEYQLKMETMRWPAIGISGEVWTPTGPNASKPAYSVKGLVTRTFPIARFHLNGSYGSYAIRIPAPPPGGGTILPPIVDGPCSVAPVSVDVTPRTMCTGSISSTTPSSATVSATALRPGTNTGIHWLAGIAADRAMPLRSILMIADVFTERYNGTGRPTDWTAELGARKQLTPRLVADFGIGRHFLGLNPSWFGTVGTTLSFAARP